LLLQFELPRYYLVNIQFLYASFLILFFVVCFAHYFCYMHFVLSLPCNHLCCLVNSLFFLVYVLMSSEFLTLSKFIPGLLNFGFCLVFPFCSCPKLLLAFCCNSMTDKITLSFNLSKFKYSKFNYSSQRSFKEVLQLVKAMVANLCSIIFIPLQHPAAYTHAPLFRLLL